MNDQLLGIAAFSGEANAWVRSLQLSITGRNILLQGCPALCWLLVEI